jgi:hypothetical protein
MHRVTLTPTQAYLERCDPAADSSLLNCMRAVEVSGPDPNWSVHSLQRPLFYEASALAAVAADISALSRLLEDVKDRCFGSSRAYLEAQGVKGELIDIILRGCVGTTCGHLRADVLIEGGQAKIIELNRGSGLGGFDISRLNEALLDQPAFAEFARAFRLEHPDTVRIVADQLRAAAVRVTGGYPPTIAMIEESGARDRAGGTSERLCHGLKNHGLNAVLGELRDLSEKDGRIYLNGGTRVDVVFRYFFASHLLASPADNAVMELLTRAHRTGKVVLFTSLDSDICERKAALALLREPHVWSTLTSGERDLIDRRVPWTRLIGTDHLARMPAHDRRLLVDECRGHRADLILKPSDGSRSAGVLLGAGLTDRQWRAYLESGALSHYVVQQRVIPDEETIVDPDSGRPEYWHVNWGIFHLDGAYGGALLRGRMAADNGVIGGPGNRSRRGCAFTY